MKLLRKVLFLLLIIGFVWLIKDQDKVSEKPSLLIEPEKSFKFAVMADIHTDEENLRLALQKAVNNGNEFVVIAGDLTTVGKKEELLKVKNILDQSGLKYYAVPGNHDVWYDRKLDQDYFSEVFGKTYGSFKKDNYKFILVNNGDYKNGLEGLRGTEGQKKWLKDETSECVQINCFVFMHMPLNHPTSVYVMGQDSPVVATEAAELVKLLAKNKINQIFAGHLHFSSSYELEGLETTITGAVTSERNFQSPKFLEISVSEKKVTKSEIFLAD